MLKYVITKKNRGTYNNGKCNLNFRGQKDLCRVKMKTSFLNPIIAQYIESHNSRCQLKTTLK